MANQKRRHILADYTGCRVESYNNPRLLETISRKYFTQKSTILDSKFLAHGPFISGYLISEDFQISLRAHLEKKNVLIDIFLFHEDPDISKMLLQFKKELGARNFLTLELNREF